MKPNPALLSAVCLIPLMATAALAQSAGVTAAVNQQAAGTPPGGSLRTIVLGDNVVQNERIDTSSDGLVQILLADGTAFTVGPNSSLSIDRFVYDPQAGTAEVAATLTQGVFRFIGGRTSKTPGGVVLNTPVGTAGIRGAIVDIILDPGSNGTVAEFAMRFGTEMTLTRCEDQTRRVRLTLCDGAERRVFQPGYSIVVGGNGRVAIVPTPPGSASAIQNALAGRPGTSGGAPVQPTNPMVAASPVPGSNSEQPLVVIAAPVPTPRPEPIARTQEIVVADATRDEIRGVVERSPEAPPAPGPDPDPEPEPPVDPDPPIDPEPPVEPEPGPTLATRLFRETPEGGVDQTIVELVETEDGRLQGVVDEQILDLPAIFDAQEDGSPAPLAPVTIGSGGSGGEGEGGEGEGLMALMVEGEPFAFLGGRPLNGVAYAGRDGFRAYLLRAGSVPGEGSGGEGSGGEGSGGEGPFAPMAVETSAGDLVFAIDGRPTDVATVFGGTGLRRYALQADPFEGFAAPFLIDYGIPAGSGVVSDLFLVESEGVAEGRAKMLQISLLIDGIGGGQRSQAAVNVGSIVDSGSGYGFDGIRRGGDRFGFGDAFSYYGNLATLAGARSGTGFFGDNGEYFVASSVTTGGLRERNATANDLFDIGTTHVGSLIDRDAVGLEGRRTEPLRGFSAGLATISGGEAGGSFFVRSEDALQTTLTFTPSTNSFGTNFELTSGGEFPSLLLSLSAGGENEPSAFATNNVYAAAARNSGVAAFVDGSLVAPVGEVGTYVFSGRAAPVAGFDPFGQGETRCETCSFIEWGWWGTQVSGPAGYAGTRTVGVHLGNWVAGDVTDAAEIEGLIGSTEFDFAEAVYEGGALGTVTSGGQTYVASGDMDMRVSLAARSGSFAIRDFDGRSFEGDVAGSGAEGFLLQNFSRIGGGVPSIGGAGVGAFVNAPGIDENPLRDAAGGVIGNFQAFEGSGGDWSATGIFAGGRTELFLLPPL